MGTIAAYSLYSGIFLLAGYMVYKLVMAGEKQTVLNRAVLLCIYAFSLSAWPLNKLFAGFGSFSSVAIADFGHIGEGSISGGGSQISAVATVMAGIYWAGVIATALTTACTAVRLRTLIGSGRHIDRESHTLVILPVGKAAPFSWGRYIVMGEDQYESAADIITTHELAHIRCRHSLDMVAAQIVCIFLWYNPSAWLMREELKTVHEYQADEQVLASGTDLRTYQMLLIKKAVGTRFQSLANSLNHSNLKKRITMMYKEKTGGFRRLRGLALALAPVAALTVVNIPAVAGSLTALGNAGFGTTIVVETPAADPTFVSEGKGTKKPEEKPAKQAGFPGGEMEMIQFLTKNIKYPDEAVKAQQEAKPLVHFIVQADGSLTDISVPEPTYPALDAEAIRVVKSMPRWTPAKNEKGEAVACEYTLPVFFRLK